MMPFYLLMLAGVAAGYYAGVAIDKRLRKQKESLVPLATAMAGGVIAYFVALSVAPPVPQGPIVWAEPVRQVFNQEELDAVLAEDPARATLVGFYANWCAPCHSEAPSLNELALAGERVAVVNVDQAPALAETYGVFGLPTVLVFRDQQEVHRESGYKSKRALQKLLTADAGS